MGFDIYGINPKTTRERPERPESYDNEEVTRAYFKDLDLFHEENPGVYYRSNVWWWRPIVDFLKDFGDDILSQEDLDGLSQNSGHVIAGETIYILRDRMQLALDEGYVEGWINVYKNALNNLPQETCYCCEGRGVLDSKPLFMDPTEDWNGDCHVCKGSGKVDNFKKNYPTDLATFEEFNTFLQNCGEGFEVW